MLLYTCTRVKMQEINYSRCKFIEIVYLFIMVIFHFRLARRFSPRSLCEVMTTLSVKSQKENPLIKVNNTIVKYVRMFSTTEVTTIYI